MKGKVKADKEVYFMLINHEKRLPQETAALIERQRQCREEMGAKALCPAEGPSQYDYKTYGHKLSEL